MIFTGACSPVRMPRDNPQQGKIISNPQYIFLIHRISKIINSIIYFSRPRSLRSLRKSNTAMPKMRYDCNILIEDFTKIIFIKVLFEAISLIIHNDSEPNLLVSHRLCLVFKSYSAAAASCFQWRCAFLNP